MKGDDDDERMSSSQGEGEIDGADVFFPRRRRDRGDLCSNCEREGNQKINVRTSQYKYSSVFKYKVGKPVIPGRRKVTDTEIVEHGR
jgi:hypothetical protein